MRTPVQLLGRVRLRLSLVIKLCALLVGPALLLRSLQLTSGDLDVSWHYAAWTPDETYTVIMTTYNRYDLWQASLRHYAAQSGVQAIVLVWNNVGEPLPALTPALRVPLYVHYSNDSQTQNRFFSVSLVPSRWIFNVDDDVRVSSADLRTGYETLRQFPQQLVGYTVRRVWHEGSEWQYSSFTRTNYHIVIGQAFWASRSTYAAYSMNKEPMVSMRAIVKELNLGDDLVLNIITSRQTHLPPVWVRAGSIAQLVSNAGKGKSAAPRWKHRRTVLLSRVAELLGNSSSLPLVAGHLRIHSLLAAADPFDWSSLRYHPLLERLYALIGVV